MVTTDTFGWDSVPMLGAHVPGLSVVMMATVTTHELAMGVFVRGLQWGIRTWQGRKFRRQGNEVDVTGVDENRIPARLLRKAVKRHRHSSQWCEHPAR